MQQSLAQIQDVSKVRDGAPDTSLWGVILAVH
jgi:hypothetical protein